MFEGDEGIQQDANLGESSAAPETSTQESQTEVSATEQTSEQSRSESQTPFHEHPRFKELLEERNTFRQQLEEMRQNMQKMQTPAQQQKEHPFVQRLREIDPQYGDWAGGVEKLQKDLAELRQWREEQAATTIRQQYETGIEKLHNDHKAPQELRDRIKKDLDYMAATNPKLTIKDLPQIYKQVFEDNRKWLDGIRRSERASYVTDKSKDSRAPTSQPKGAPATATKQKAYTDREDMIGSIVKKSLIRSKAESDI